MNTPRKIVPALRHPFGTTESLTLEFKRASDRLPGNFFDTVCAFLNMDGGLIEHTLPENPAADCSGTG